tara:strand:+ start:36182 stop:37012 length:831 start_codon:yes stop_codon:yes gene_type:complete
MQAKCNDMMHVPTLTELWQIVHDELNPIAQEEPIIASFLYATVLKHETMCSSLSYVLANALSCEPLPAIAIREIIDKAYKEDKSIIESAKRDLCAFYTRDPSCDLYSTPFLYYKGFHALQAHRIAHWLWQNNRKSLARLFQNRISAVLGVDIHPGARIGSGILMDHAHGVVIGETAVVGDDVSILHAVTLGGTGKESGDRHPKVMRGVLIAAGAKILGNVTIGECAKIAAGSVVLEDVPPCTTVAGVPAKIVSQNLKTDEPALAMDHSIREKLTQQ